MAYVRLVTVHIPLLGLLLFLLPFFILLLFSIHILYLSPLKVVPGPKVAALTRLYEFYHNAIRSYKYAEQIELLHGHYGAQTRPLLMKEI